MSRPPSFRPASSRHRKSQSTSALSTLGLTVNNLDEKRKVRTSQHPALGRVDESSSNGNASGPSRSQSRQNLSRMSRMPTSASSASLAELPGLSNRQRSGEERRRESEERAETTDVDEAAKHEGKDFIFPLKSSRQFQDGAEKQLGAKDESGARSSSNASWTDEDRSSTSSTHENTMEDKKVSDTKKAPLDMMKRIPNDRASETSRVDRRGSIHEVRSWMRDIMSIRSSHRRRREALRHLDRTFLQCCEDRSAGMTGKGLEHLSLAAFVRLNIHTSLLTLLTRHAQTLCKRGTSLPPGDEAATSLSPELVSIIGILQGLCLVSHACKEAVGEIWIMELLIDLLLTLRAQPPLSLPSAVVGPSTQRSTAYMILDLLFCILVDSPQHVRVLEELSGLEAVTRVLKGSGVSKEVKMKCVEFLYFYLQPEGAPGSRNVSASSTVSSASAESHLYPKSPFSSPLLSSDGRTTPVNQISGHFEDLNFPFVPQTPNNPARHALGFPTPNHSRRISGSITPSLAPVPGSPGELLKSPISKLRHNERSRSRHSDDHVKRQIDQTDDNGRRWSAADGDGSNKGLGFGISKSTTMASGLASRDSSMAPPRSPIDPFGPTPAEDDKSRSSSGSSTAVPPLSDGGRATPEILPSSGMKRSSTQPVLDRADMPNVTARRPSVRRANRTPVVVSEVEEESTGSSVAGPDRPPKIRHSRTQSHFSGLNGLSKPSHRDSMPPPAIIPRRSNDVDRRQSSIQSASTDPVVSPASMVSSKSVASNTAERLTQSTYLDLPKPSPAKRAFPAGLTKGLPPSASTPNLAARLSGSSTPLGANSSVSSTSTSTPLGANESASSVASRESRPSPAVLPLGSSKRIPSASDKRPLPTSKTSKDLRSVDEKKAMLGSWLGNVDALVSGVEKVSFWGSVDQRGG